MGVILAATGLVAVAALFWSAYGTYYVMRREPGDERMRRIQGVHPGGSLGVHDR
ncbi:MAG: hypothetical protein ACP5JD_01365 [Candidatus Bipolaricaulaceae bacterium]